MKKNILIAIIVIIFIVVLGVCAYIFLNNKGESKTIDIDAAGQTLANSSPFNEMSTIDITTEQLNSSYGINIENVETLESALEVLNQ